MDSKEREQLLDLWRRVPECRPKVITPYQSHNGYIYFEHATRTTPAQGAPDPMLLDEDSEVVPLSRDAIVEWLIGKGFTDYNWELGTPTCDDDWSLTLSMRSFSGPTRLLALIAAAMSVASENEGRK